MTTRNIEDLVLMLNAFAKDKSLRKSIDVGVIWKFREHTSSLSKNILNQEYDDDVAKQTEIEMKKLEKWVSKLPTKDEAHTEFKNVFQEIFKAKDKITSASNEQGIFDGVNNALTKFFKKKTTIDSMILQSANAEEKKESFVDKVNAENQRGLY